MTTPSISSIIAHPKHYAWGDLHPCEVSELTELNSGGKSDGNEDGNLPFAELWIGTHEAAPSLVEGTQASTLIAFLEKDPAGLLGNEVAENYGARLPFLLKVLSVRKPLSLQAHPDKMKAEELNSMQPSVYMDDSDKPEMALALTRFIALSGFSPGEEIESRLEEYPELADALEEAGIETGREKSKEREEGCRRVFNALMQLSQSAVKKHVDRLHNRLMSSQNGNGNAKGEAGGRRWVTLRLCDNFPGDVGVLASILLNIVALEPEQALCIPANEPHAYVTGECVEVMKASDNVIRAGLTSKHKDVSTLSSVLNFHSRRPIVVDALPSSSDSRIREHTPPFNEFKLRSLALESEESALMSVTKGPSVVLFLRGSGKIVYGNCARAFSRGGVAFVPNGVEFSIHAEGGHGQLFAVQACVGDGFFE